MAGADVGKGHAAMGEIIGGRGSTGWDVGEASIHTVCSRGESWTVTRRSGRVLWCRLSLQLVATCLVPHNDLWVGFGRKARSWNLGWEALASVGVDEIPVLDGIINEGDVLFRVEQDLDGLPAHEAALGQARNRGSCEVVVGGLEGMAAAKDLEDVREGLVRGIEEEFCVRRGRASLVVSKQPEYGATD